MGMGTRASVVRQILLLITLALSAVRCGRQTLEENKKYQACQANPPGCTSLSLPAARLTGSLPSQLGLLTALDYLCVAR